MHKKLVTIDPEDDKKGRHLELFSSCKEPRKG